MKVLSDFDGVLTDQTEEGHRVRELLREELIARSGGLPAEELDALLEAADSEMDAAPHSHGWKVNGRITAFSDEDLFVRNNALAACLDGQAARGVPLARALLAKIHDGGLADFNALANVAYERMVKETASGAMKPIDPSTKTVFAKLLAAGHEVVVVSNSNTARILDLFRAEGIDCVGHDEDPTARKIVRVRGGAQKYGLGATARVIPLGSYQVDTSRPSYEAILREERADAVIGDVLTLDLALPLYLARTEPKDFGGICLILRERDYTPDWSRRAMREVQDAGGVRCAVISSLEEVPLVLKGAVGHA